MNTNDEIFINQIIQKVKTVEEGLEWFSKLDEQNQLITLRFIYNMSMQAHTNESDIELAINNSKLKSTYTPCVLLKQGRFNIQISKILNLPRNEYEKSFVLLIHLFIIADERRRRLECKGNCSHWWP